MPAPLLAAPLVIPFAEAIGVSIAALGMAKATDKVNEFIQENPEQSIKIFQMIMPAQGIANALKNKSSEGDEEVSEDIDVEVEEKPKKLTGREKGMRIKEAIRRARAGKGNYSSPDAEGPAVDIRGSVIREVEDMGIADKDLKDNYDPDKPKFDYKKFFKKRYADGGAIGIEVLLEEENPRQGLFMGGSPLTGQALSIYNSMNAYGFDDQAIADALAAQGLYTPSGAPVVEEPVTNTAPNIINQGGGDSGPQGIATVPGTYGKEYTGMTMPDGTPIGSMIEMEGPGVIDSLTNTAGNLFGLYQKFSPVGIISKFMKDRSTQQQTLQNNALAKAEAERKAKEAIARAEAEAAALASAQRTGRRPGSGGDGPGTKDSGGPTGGYSYDGGGRQGFGYGLKDGGLAAMFKKKR
jgi:hypothetical protein